MSFDDLLNKTVTAQQPIKTRDLGGQVLTFSPVRTQRMAIQENREPFVVERGGQADLATHRGYNHIDEPVDIDWRIIDGPTTFRVIAVRAAAGRGHHQSTLLTPIVEDAS